MGDNVTAGVIVYKLISVLGFAAIAWAVPRIARALGGDPALALWLGVANPVMILHMVGGMHNESVMVGLVSIGLLACLHKRFLLGVALIAVAVSLKATAAIALPFVVWMATHHYSRHMHRFLAFVVTGFVGLVETLAVVAAVTWLSGSSWGWLSEISGNSKVINPLALPSLLASGIRGWCRSSTPASSTTPPGQLRSISMVLMLAGWSSWWMFRHTTRRASPAPLWPTRWRSSSPGDAALVLRVGDHPRRYRPSAGWVLRLAVGASTGHPVLHRRQPPALQHVVMAGVFVLAWVLTDWSRRRSEGYGCARRRTSQAADRAERRPDAPAESHPR